MKKLILIILLLSPAFAGVFAQRTYTEDGDIGKKNLAAKRVVKTTLVVLLDEDAEAYSDKLKASVGKFWKHTPVEYARIQDAELYLKDKEYSILTLLKHRSNIVGDDRTSGYSYSILLGNPRNKEFNDAEIAASVHLPVQQPKRGDLKIRKHDHLLSFFIQNLNSKLSRYLEYEALEGKKQHYAYFNEGGYEALSNKVVIIDKSVLDEEFTVRNFCKNFRLSENQVKVLSAIEIERIIEEQDEGYALVYDFNPMGNVYDLKNATALAYGSGANIFNYKAASYGISAVALIVVILLL